MLRVHNHFQSIEEEEVRGEFLGSTYIQYKDNTSRVYLNCTNTFSHLGFRFDVHAVAQHMTLFEI